MSKLRKDRVFKHMAKDTPDRKVVRICRDELIKNLEFPDWFREIMVHWRRLMEIKHGDDFIWRSSEEFDLHKNEAIFVMSARPRSVRGSSVKDICDDKS